MKPLRRPALLFVAIGLAIYGALFAASEVLMHRQARSNPLFKVEQVRDTRVDWVVLGASHAMPLDFDAMNSGIERSSGQQLVQLAGPGTGPLYNRFVLEQFLRRHSATHLLYVVDAFTFYSPAWNEDRFVDAKLLRRTPWDMAVASSLAGYVWRHRVDPRALLDYATGFSKINNRDRFEKDVWEGERQFEQVARPSKTAVRKRIAYLYPDGSAPEARARYMAEFAALLTLARQHGMQVTVIKMPLPAGFRQQLPADPGFDAELARLLDEQHAAFADFAAALPDPTLYFDTDHLNRAGVDRFVAQCLGPLLTADAR